MAAPSALAAVTPVTPIVQSAVKVLSTELVRFEGKVYRRIRLKEPRRDKSGALLFTKAGRVRMHTVTRMEPVEIAASLNPVGLGVLGILAAGAAVILFGRISGGLPLGGEFEIYKGPFADEFDAWRGTRAAKKLPGSGSESEQCRSAYETFNANRTIGIISPANLEVARQIWDSARQAGCAWTATTSRP